jgi:hypothetical protein
MTSSLYRACEELFAGYPLATRVVSRSETIVRSMVLMLRHGENAQFFVLSYDGREGKASYCLRPWRGAGVAQITADDTISRDVDVNAVTSGVPIPKDGSLFGWVCGDTVTALVAVYAKYRPGTQEPSWTMMPFADIPEVQWPPFADEHLLGRWFWEHYRTGRIILLNGPIAEASETVYWVDTRTILSSGTCVVARDVTCPDGCTLRRGRYVYYQALRAGKPVPPLMALLADTSKIDLAPGFRQFFETAVVSANPK